MPYDYLRMQNLYGNDPYEFGEINFPSDIDYGGGFNQGMNISPPQVNQMDLYARLNQLYQPETEASKRFTELATNFPKRESPSFLRRIGASLVSKGKGGPQAAERALYGPFYRNVADWQMQIEPAYQAANLERQSNVNERTIANQMLGRELETRRIDETERTHKANEAIRQQRADIYALRSARPNLKFDTSGPTVLAMDPDNGQVTDTGVPTGALTEVDKLMLQNQHRMSQINAQGIEQRKTENVRQEGRLEAIEKREAGIRTRPPRTTATGNRPELPTQTKVRQYNAARELYNSRPDLRPFITLGSPGTNDFQIKQPSPNAWFGNYPDQTQYNQMTQAIYGVGITPSHTSTNAGSTAPKQPIQNQQAAPTDKRSKAIEFLKQNNLPITDKNIQHAIATGRVK